jgi:hypothetical protein
MVFQQLAPPWIQQRIAYDCWHSGSQINMGFLADMFEKDRSWKGSLL